MKNSIGNLVTFTIFGESHGPCIGGVLDGLPAGIELNEGFIEKQMEKRKAKGAISTKRHEEDKVKFVSGLFEGKTTGSPLAFIIENNNTRSGDYAQLKYRLRPGHADFAAFEKYDGYQDYRGGGHFSGRLTACITAAGAICLQILNAHGVKIATHILNLHGLEDVPFFMEGQLLDEQMDALNDMDFAVLDPQVKAAMEKEIESAAMSLDSVGGILQTVVTGLPSGIGEPMFGSVESRLSQGLFSIPACKAVSFGDGFGFASLNGSQANDPLDVHDGKIVTKTNRNGGINGGITNGMPILFQTCIKPTPSIYKPQSSVDYQTRTPVTLEIKGRHDPAVIHRARVVQDSMTALVLLDLWMERNAVLSFQRS